MRRLAPTFAPGPLSTTQAEALNGLARDLYSLLYSIQAAAPLQWRIDATGVSLSLDAAALQAELNNLPASLGPTDTLADLNDAGDVSLANQSMGQGDKYFAGLLTFGSGTKVSPATTGATLQYNGVSLNKTIFVSIASSDYAEGTIGGLLIGQTERICALRVKNIARHPKFGYFDDDTGTYLEGVWGRGGGGDTFSGGLCTGLAPGGTTPTPGPGTGTGGSGSGGPVFLSAAPQWWNVARMSYSLFSSSGTQVEFYSQPGGHDNDKFTVEITRPFKASLAGGITLDMGTVGNPTGYVNAFDLTQARGSYSISTPASTGLGLNGLSASMSLKARVNYTGSLTDGEFKIHTREAIVCTQDDPSIPWLPSSARPPQPQPVAPVFTRPGWQPGM